jgi:hypothetical protein
MAHRRGLVALVAGFVAAFAILPLFQSLGPLGRWVAHAIHLLNGPSEHGASWLTSFVARALVELMEQTGSSFPRALLAGTLLVGGGLLARALAQSRVRDGRADPIEPLRRLIARRPAFAHAIAWTPGVAWALFVASTHGHWLRNSEWLWGGEISHPTAWVAAAVVGTVGIATGMRAAARGGLRALAAPIVTDVDAPASPKLAGDITFSAVAVTPRTRGAVAAMAVTSLAMVAWVTSASTPMLVRDPRYLAVIAAYVAAASAVAFVFRRAARITVGIDGILVGDSFYAYRDVDEARASGADLDVVRGGRVVLRLQMHGEDAGRRDEVLARVTRAIALGKERGTRGAEAVVQSMPSRRVAAASAGAESYRYPAPSREQLWELIEGPTTDVATRRAAAEALAVQLDSSERARLRVAAEHCAEPRARVALEALADEEADVGPAASARRHLQH